MSSSSSGSLLLDVLTDDALDGVMRALVSAGEPLLVAFCCRRTRDSLKRTTSEAFRALHFAGERWSGRTVQTVAWAIDHAGASAQDVLFSNVKYGGSTRALRHLVDVRGASLVAQHTLEALLRSVVI
ncbi:hypothetical protein KFE25_009250 [Diacronema lutheri]|uniref:Uncharacterized protein n=1 Tax=Diacronema lutheri TaxID=2081491 RepID=A0A8J6CFL4_DIALT|nr:hypothetical protein KFE25_009250 [Diacronema lutheri]